MSTTIHPFLLRPERERSIVMRACLSICLSSPACDEPSSPFHHESIGIRDQVKPALKEPDCHQSSRQSHIYKLCLLMHLTHNGQVAEII